MAIATLAAFGWVAKRRQLPKPPVRVVRWAPHADPLIVMAGLIGIRAGPRRLVVLRR
jgi:hypothetical protein